jgi:hypothetical protein
MILLFFGSKSCVKCATMLMLLKEFNLTNEQFVYIDIMDNKNEEISNIFNVWEVPYTVIIDDLKNMNILFERQGYFNVNILKEKLLNS